VDDAISVGVRALDSGDGLDDGEAPPVFVQEAGGGPLALVGAGTTVGDLYSHLPAGAVA
jgi:hypothetical protein